MTATRVYLIHKPADPQLPWQLWAIGGDIPDYYVGGGKTKGAMLARARDERWTIVELGNGDKRG